ncbi:MULTISPECIES: DUF421 domain-containing protein [Treponema]|uniref:DUF421 domain-containing protein n=1 Tax=Treponema TaxID=157 RepID=UPI0005301302|nr:MULTISPECIES: DUF421 domain-containing protein [Treponema]AIW89684.1 membrane protein [Treponema sp. OMZ 838]UTC43098.1 DUF421 domain-containing protein [Treponema sp. OMZ 857]UTC46956.1 DUF421 domain-containing protein [Treponema vincentii]UTC50275.1 DUF421 domain-containing protein [Treponema sp. OMZ 855]
MGVFLLVTIKLLIGFFAMVVIINISGKGNLAPSSASDQIINYVFGGVMGGAIYNSSVRIPDFIVVLCIWCVFVLSMKWVKKRNLKAKQLIDGKALIIIDDGKIDITNCKKARLSAHDVAFKLRTNGIYSSKAVKRALVEQNGQFIIIQAGEENPKFPIITDGQVQSDILKVIGKDEEWLLDELKKQGIGAYSDVFLGEYVDKTLIVTPYQ